MDGFEAMHNGNVHSELSGVVGNAVMGRFDELPQDVLKAVMQAQSEIIKLEEKLRNTMEDGGTPSTTKPRRPTPRMPSIG